MAIVVGKNAARLLGALFVVGALALTTAATPSGAADGGALTRYPYLTDLVGRHVQVNWATTTAVASGAVTYGKVGTEPCTAHTVAATPTAITVGPTAETMWSASLGGLTRTGSYCYGVLGDGTSLLGADPAPRFRAQVAAGSEKRFSFAVLGDWGAAADGTNPDQENVLTQIAASGVRFAVTTGDTAYPDGSQKNYGDLQQTGPDTSAVFGPSFWAKVGASVPLFNTQGNHGLTSDALVNWPEPRAVTTSGGRYQMDVYPSVLGTNPANYPSEWYAFNAGQARFYVLDASWNNANVPGSITMYEIDAAQHWSPTSAEYLWLQNDLATHPAAMRFAFFHFPLYTDSSTEKSDPYLQGAGQLEGMLANAGVKLIFNGHAHIYQRNGPSAAGMPVSYVTGTGGGDLEPANVCGPPGLYAIGWHPSLAVGSACGTATKPVSPDHVYGFLKVTVRGTTVTVTPIDELGRTFDVQTYDFSSTAR